ncbi:hypothetical protein CAOG_03319 [Capsaspora owczarzaki ATCC 30864]|uniref:Uncharacterized protein n=1 Tax=Capsaspora owczarzaki (strain ATCC 30864) TaxID=595528 RepID=A0A0D2VPD9_CAPO3|nr:hypothetical protein CAOG_03319 [Capsaspora owczarzaki ATCC 30864]KJE92332.1 hypothetical protein CAOG_003319 [Capsaspora owczarzaki ATCC 30864]|eukprot:XP_004364158.2 hypothetical protein CAOG_03319 [Capsaspora owczarzaki ATCC 30864]
MSDAADVLIADINTKMQRLEQELARFHRNREALGEYGASLDGIAAVWTAWMQRAAAFQHSAGGATVTEAARFMAHPDDDERPTLPSRS